MKVFEGLKVVEFASVLAGPLVGRFFAECGAEVIKIEDKRRGGDVTRGWKTRSEDPSSDDSSYFHSANWGKESVFLNLKEPGDLDQALQYCKSADVVLSNFKPRSARKLGVDHRSVSRINPEVIYAEIHSFFGDPDRPAYDIALQAETGYLSMCGTAEGQHTRMPVAMIDVLTAHQAKEAILIALIEKMKRGTGAHIILDLESVAISSLANQGANALNTGVDPKPMGTAHPNIVPYGDIFSSSDGIRFVLAVGSDQQFRILCQKLGVDQLLGEAYDTNAKRVRKRMEVVSTLAEGLKKHLYSDLSDIFIAYKIPFGRLCSVRQALKSEAASELIVESIGIQNPKKSIQTCTFSINFEKK